MASNISDVGSDRFSVGQPLHGLRNMWHQFTSCQSNSNSFTIDVVWIILAVQIFPETICMTHNDKQNHRSNCSLPHLHWSMLPGSSPGWRWPRHLSLRPRLFSIRDDVVVAVHDSSSSSALSKFTMIIRCRKNLSRNCYGHNEKHVGFVICLGLIGVIGGS